MGHIGSQKSIAVRYRGSGPKRKTGTCGVPPTGPSEAFRKLRCLCFNSRLDPLSSLKALPLRCLYASRKLSVLPLWLLQRFQIVAQIPYPLLHRPFILLVVIPEDRTPCRHV